MKIIFFYLLSISFSAFAASTHYDRDMAIIATDEGFYPEKIVVFEGERVRFNFTSLSTSKEMSCLYLREFDLYLGAEKGALSFGEATFRRPGRYKFYCPQNDHYGIITVVTDDESFFKSKKGYWVPRDETRNYYGEN